MPSSLIAATSSKTSYILNINRVALLLISSSYLMLKTTNNEKQIGTKLINSCSIAGQN